MNFRRFAILFHIDFSSFSGEPKKCLIILISNEISFPLFLNKVSVDWGYFKSFLHLMIIYTQIIHLSGFFPRISIYLSFK